MAQTRILLIEDEPAWQDILREKVQRALDGLNRTDALVQQVLTFEAASPLLKDGSRWDLVVTDLGLPSNPQKLGKTLVERASELNIPVIVVSGVANTMDVRAFFTSEQVQDFFSKDDFAAHSKVFIERVAAILSRSDEESAVKHSTSHSTPRDESVVRSGGRNAMKILFLAANPSQTSHLDLEEELRSLEQELRGVKFRDSVSLSARHAVRADDLIRHVRADKPNVIHFSGHGSTAGIILRDDVGGFQAVEGANLRRFLEGRGVELVVLNACYSKGQADTIQGAVKTVVGTTDAVGDEAARRFTVAFYRSLGDGLSVREAFRDGGDAVALHGLDDVFHSGGDLDLVLVTAAIS